MAIIKLDTKQTFVDSLGNEVDGGDRYIPTIHKDHEVYYISIIDFETGIEYSGLFSYESKDEIATVLDNLKKNNEVDLDNWFIID